MVPFSLSIAPNLGAPLVAVVGPTASGKSDLGLRLAREFRGEIIACDSIQVYQGLDIGSAKTPHPLRGDSPHHLIDVVPPEADFTAGDFARLGRELLPEITARGNLPIVVGGTGLYLRALLDGLSPGDSDSILRKRLREGYQARPAVLHRYLRRFNPMAAASIHPNDVHKLLRAVELTKLGLGKAAPRSRLEGYRVLKISLVPERSQLHNSINTRSTRMFSEGLLEEVARLLAVGISPGAKSLQSLGYKQAIEHLHGKLSLEEAIAQCQTKTRQYAKRQLTWYRHEPGITTVAGFGSYPTVQHECVNLVRNFLGNF